MLKFSIVCLLDDLLLETYFGSLDDQLSNHVLVCAVAIVSGS